MKIYGYFLSDEVLPTFGMPIYKDSDRKLYLAEVLDNKIKGFTAFTGGSSHVHVIYDAPSEIKTIGDNSDIVIVSVDGSYIISDINQIGNYFTLSQHEIRANPFFAMEFFELLNDRKAYLDSALCAAEHLSFIGEHIYHKWLNIANLDAGAIQYIEEHIGVRGISYGESEIYNIYINAPFYACSAIEKLMNDNNKRRLDEIVSIEIRHRNAIRAERDFDYSVIFRPIQFDRFCKLVRVNFIQEENLKIVRSAYRENIKQFGVVRIALSRQSREKWIRETQKLERMGERGTRVSSDFVGAVKYLLFEKREDLIRNYNEVLSNDLSGARKAIRDGMAQRRALIEGGK